MSNEDEDIIVAVEIDGEYVCRICLASEDLSKYDGNNVLMGNNVKMFQCDRCRTLIYREAFARSFFEHLGVEAAYSVNSEVMLKNVHSPEEMDEYMKKQTPFFRR